MCNFYTYVLYEFLKKNKINYWALKMLTEGGFFWLFFVLFSIAVPK